jgi:hypothetical protein
MAALLVFFLPLLFQLGPTSCGNVSAAPLQLPDP